MYIGIKDIISIFFLNIIVIILGFLMHSYDNSLSYEIILIVLLASNIGCLLGLLIKIKEKE